MFENTQDLNIKYTVNYNSRPLTFLEKKIFNEDKKLNLKDYDLTNPEILGSLSIYYDIQYIKEPSQENENLRLCILLKLSKFEPKKGNLRMGCFYSEKKDYIKGIEYWKKAIEFESPEAYMNLFLTQKEINEKQDLDLLFNALKLKYYPVIILIVLHLLEIKDFTPMSKFLEYGIYKECDDFMKILNKFIPSYLLRLPFTSKLIQDKKAEIFHRVIESEINEDRDKTLIIQLSENFFIIPGSSKELIGIYG
uniref:Tetratricopeptide repeat protein n=1 Tax=viral metagenome TaxID=1070528 RepID=A0A6C0AFU1_9ZZZZ